MNKFFSTERGHSIPYNFWFPLCLAVSLSLTYAPTGSAQSVDPAPTPASTPAVDPTPAPAPTPVTTLDPTDTPVPTATPIPIGTPQFTLTPGLPDPSVISAYNALHTPLVDVTLNTAAAGSLSPAATSSVPATASTRQLVQNGICAQVALLAPAKSKAASTTSTTSGVTSQPVATVVLTYDLSRAGQLVWVQMLGTGTLTADDGAGHSYDGSKGFFLTLDVNAMATFNYQAPNISGTYQVFTRLDNVATILPFLIPDSAR